MTYNDTFIRACRQQSTEHVPVWYMRQAGRYDPEYRKIKEKYSLLEICRQPELAAEITLMPVRKLGVDAAILYSDIMNPVASLGLNFDIVKNIGPVIENPIRSAADVDRLKPIDVEGDLGHILETISLLDKELDVPLITFAGAPFTIASYLIEGRPSKSYHRTKEMMFSQPRVWEKLMEKLGDMVITYLRAHVRSGGKAFQLFDSWVGALARVTLKPMCCRQSPGFLPSCLIWMFRRFTSRVSAQGAAPQPGQAPGRCDRTGLARKPDRRQTQNWRRIRDSRQSGSLSADRTNERIERTGERTDR